MINLILAHGFFRSAVWPMKTVNSFHFFFKFNKISNFLSDGNFRKMSRDRTLDRAGLTQSFADINFQSLSKVRQYRLAASHACWNVVCAICAFFLLESLRLRFVDGTKTKIG